MIGSYIECGGEVLPVSRDARKVSCRSDSRTPADSPVTVWSSVEPSQGMAQVGVKAGRRPGLAYPAKMPCSSRMREGEWRGWLFIDGDGRDGFRHFFCLDDAGMSVGTNASHGTLPRVLLWEWPKVGISSLSVACSVSLFPFV